MRRNLSSPGSPTCEQENSKQKIKAETRTRPVPASHLISCSVAVPFCFSPFLSLSPIPLGSCFPLHRNAGGERRRGRSGGGYGPCDWWAHRRRRTGAGAVKCHCVTAPAAAFAFLPYISLALVLACSESKTGEAAEESRLSSEMTGGGLPALFASCL